MVFQGITPGQDLFQDRRSLGWAWLQKLRQDRIVITHTIRTTTRTTTKVTSKETTKNMLMRMLTTEQYRMLFPEDPAT